MAIEIVKEGGGGGGNVVLGFILGGVMIAVAIMGFFMWDNYKGGGAPAAPAAVHIIVKGK